MISDEHDDLVKRAEEWLIKRGFRILRKSPAPNVRPDISAEKKLSRNTIVVLIEVETAESLHRLHTDEQLEEIDNYLRIRKRLVKKRGYLAVNHTSKRDAKVILDRFENPKFTVLSLK